jgi:hypothetical protein
MSQVSQLLTYATVASVVIAVVLAVARDVPILHLIAPPDTDFGDWSGVLVCPLVIAAILFGSPWLKASGWIVGMAYFWWVAAWHLRERW